MQKAMNGLAQKQIKTNYERQVKNLPNGTQVKKALSGILSTAKAHGKTEKSLVSRVSSAIQNLKHLIQQGQNSVVVVVSIKRVNKQLPVYDLTVEHEHCYFANGFLVSNSDAFRQFAQSYTVPIQSIPLSNENLPYWAQ
jgi:hypothetical protein